MLLYHGIIMMGFNIWITSGVEGPSGNSCLCCEGVEGDLSYPDRCDRLQSDPSHRGLRKLYSCSAGLHHLRHLEIISLGTTKIIFNIHMCAAQRFLIK
jgi:hypothetical protein